MKRRLTQFQLSSKQSQKSQRTTSPSTKTVSESSSSAREHYDNIADTTTKDIATEANPSKLLPLGISLAKQPFYNCNNRFVYNNYKRFIIIIY